MLESWTTAFLEHHDKGRNVDRFGPCISGHQAAAATMVALSVAALSETLLIYQVQGIGMGNVPESWTQRDFRDKVILR